MSRINWSTAAQGARVVPVLLIHGVGVVIVPEGVTLTGCTVSTSPDGWWPGVTFASWSTYVRDWMRLEGDGITISERAIPSAAQLLDVSEVTIHLSDVNDAVTELFENADNLTASYITATISATATTVPVVSTTGFASSGFVYVDQEAIAYSGKTATSFTGCTRGRFGSVPARHLYNVTQGSGLGNPQATDGPPEMTGRPATLWLAEVSVAGVVTALQLEFYGTVGTGAALIGGGDSIEDGWVITLDHAIKRMGQTIRAAALSVGGYAHPGNLGARTSLTVPSPTDMTPFWLSSYRSVGVEHLAILTGDAAAPDLGGWHPTREAFVSALNVAGSATFAGATFNASLDGDALKVAVTGLASSSQFIATSPCCATTGAASGGSATSFVYNFGSMSKSWVPVLTDSPVYLSASDYAAVPSAPDLSGSGLPSTTTAQFALIFGDDTDRGSRRVARITSQGTSGSAYFVVASAVTTERVRFAGYYASTLLGRTTSWRGGVWAPGFVITEPTTARLCLYVQSNTWVDALHAIVLALDVEYSSIANSIDWDRMATIAAQFPSAIDQRRDYIVDLNTSLLSIIQNEAQLNGFALVMHEGRVCITRIAEFAVTEHTATTITDNDLDANSPSPTYEKGADGIINTYSVLAPDAGVTVNVTDRTSHAKYGGQGTITATMPRSLTGSAQDASRLYVQVFSQAAMVLGPLRYPYRHVTVRVPLHRYDLQVGDLALVSLWRVPNGRGGRGITDEVAQVIAREVVLYGEAVNGHVAYTFRLNPRNLQGYAPTLLVAEGGITGAIVTADTVTFGSGGFAGASFTDGGASTFNVGDLVRLVEIDSATPTTSTQHEVVAVSGSTIELDPAPNATFTSLVASPTGTLKVMVVYDDWDVVTAAARAIQQRFAYLADASFALDASTAARTYAA